MTCLAPEAYAQRMQRMTLATDISVALTVSTMLTALAAGLTVRRADAAYLLRHPRRFARAFFAINVAMPFCTLWFTDVFSLEPSVELALIVLAMSPLPAAIPSALRRGDATASFGARLIAAESLIAVATIPLSFVILRALFGAPFTIPEVDLIWIVASRVTVPLAVGAAAAAVWPRVGARIANASSDIAVVLLALALVPEAFLVWSSMLPLAEDGTVIAILALAAIGLFLGYTLGGPSSVDRAVLAAGNSWRHPGLALTIASVAYHDNTRAAASLLLSVVVGTLAIRPFAWRRIQAPSPTALGTSRSHAM
jgi:BASS family bile acid:Na+ symporter